MQKYLSVYLKRVYAFDVILILNKYKMIQWIHNAGILPSKRLLNLKHISGTRWD